MMRITRETDYGIVLMSLMAQNPDLPYNSAELAQQRGLPLPMVSKILKALTRAQLLISQRGVLGGYRLARSPEAISVADIIAALEGPIAVTECNLASEDNNASCIYQAHCSVTGHWRRINAAIYHALSAINLSELSQPASLLVGTSLAQKSLDYNHLTAVTK